MGNILKMAKQVQIKTLTQLGWSDRRISKALNLDRGTVSKYRKHFENPPQVPTDFSLSSVENPPQVPTDFPGAPKTQSNQIHPYREKIKTKYLQHLSAQRIYQDLVEEEDYQGSYDSIKRYVRKLKNKIQRYRDHLNHPPGRECQVDFGKSPCLIRKDGSYRKVWLFKMTLSYSKHSYEELVESQDLETFIRCHERGFYSFGGVPEIVTLDNLKSGVLRACLYDPELNETYLSFASHWGFAPNPCMPKRPEHKGIVERDIGYTKSNALKGRRFENLEEGNRFLRHWNRRWAQTRIHGSTKQQVWTMFNRVERALLGELSDRSFEYFKIGIRKVDVNGLIEVQSRYYAVPPRFVGEKINIHFNQEWIKVFWKGLIIITHRVLKRKGQVVQPISCFPSWKHPDLESQEKYYLRKARIVGNSFHRVVYKILSIPNNPLSIRQARGMMHLLKSYGPELIEEASNQALTLHNFRYRTLRNLCNRIRDEKNAFLNKKTQLTQNHELIRPLTEYEHII